MNNNNPQLKIDIEKILASKSTKLARLTPRFVINYLKRIIHQDFLNHVLDKYSNYKGVDFAEKVLEELNVKCNIKYEDASLILPNEKYIFVSNHPLGGLDGIALIKYIGRMYNNKIRFIVNDLLMNVKPFEDIFIPVNKHGAMTKEYSNLITEAYESENQILYFPAGLCSRRINGQITDLEWKTNYLRQAIKHNISIVPVHVNAQNSKFFYRLANIRKALGIKFNIEMLYLPDEMYKQRNSSFDIFIGKPINIREIKENTDIKTWNTKIRQESYSLSKL